MSGVLRGSARSGLGLWINFLSLWLVGAQKQSMARSWESAEGERKVRPLAEDQPPHAAAGKWSEGVGSAAGYYELGRWPVTQVADCFKEQIGVIRYGKPRILVYPHPLLTHNLSSSTYHPLLPRPSPLRQVGLPLAAFLALYLGLGPKGLWMGIAAMNLLQVRLEGGRAKIGRAHV